MLKAAVLVLLENRKRLLFFFYICIFLCTGAVEPSAAEALPLRIVINIPAYRLFLYRGEEVYKVYPVAVGKPEERTPVGSYKIECIVKDPVWYPPDKEKDPVQPGPENPLGKWWMGFRKGYGIHGNNNEASIGHSVSRGCIRMANKDLSEIVKIVQVGTPVEIIYKPYTWYSLQRNCPQLLIYEDIYGMNLPMPEMVSAECEQLFPERRLFAAALPKLLGQKGVVPLPWQKKVIINGREAGTGFGLGESHYLPAVMTQNLQAYLTTAFKVNNEEYISLDNLARTEKTVKFYASDNYIYIFAPHLSRAYDLIPLPAEVIQGKLYLQLDVAAHEAGLPFRWDGRSNTANLGDIQVEGIAAGNTFWLSEGCLSLILPRWGWVWDSERMEMRRGM